MTPVCSSSKVRIYVINIYTHKVPDNLGPGSYKLAVHGTHGLKFANETDLNYEFKSVSIFIQTDKAMYKPGQTGIPNGNRYGFKINNFILKLYLHT